MVGVGSQEGWEVWIVEWVGWEMVAVSAGKGEGRLEAKLEAKLVGGEAKLGGGEANPGEEEARVEPVALPVVAALNLLCRTACRYCQRLADTSHRRTHRKAAQCALLCTPN